MLCKDFLIIYALHPLEQLKVYGLDFVFKGGTRLVLLLEQDNRFSIDIDIICKVNQKDLEYQKPTMPLLLIHRSI